MSKHCIYHVIDGKRLLVDRKLADYLCTSGRWTLDDPKELKPIEVKENDHEKSIRWEREQRFNDGERKTAQNGSRTQRQKRIRQKGSS